MSGITRRGLLGRVGAIAAGAAGLGSLAAVARADSHTLYELVPITADGCTTGGCSACSACRAHAANGYFADAQAADLHRAHPYCRCIVRAGPTVSPETYTALFGVPSAVARPRVDLRTPWVQDVLAEAQVSAPGSPPAVAPIPPAGPTAPSGPHDPVVAPARVRVLDFRVRRVAPRHFRILLRLDGAAHVHARLLTADGHRLERSSYAATSGVNAHVFRAPNGADPGTYRLSVTVRSATGEHETLSRHVTIVPPKPARPVPHPKYEAPSVIGPAPPLRVAELPKLSA